MNIDKDVPDIQALFGRPMLIPAEFKRWMVDQFALAVPSIPLSALVGGRTIERVLDVVTTPVTVSGDAEATVYTLRIPGKTVAKNGRLKLDFATTIQDSAQAHTAVVTAKLDGVAFTSISNRAFFTTADPQHAGLSLWNMNDYASQTCEIFVNNVERVISFEALDLSTDHTLTITVDWTSGTANTIFVLKSAIVTVFNPEPAT